MIPVGVYLLVTGTAGYLSGNHLGQFDLLVTLGRAYVWIGPRMNHRHPAGSGWI
jgi:hypothetical protein